MALSDREKFKFKLAAHLGMSLSELEKRVSYKELKQWQEYHREEPFIADRLERMLAQLTAALSGGKVASFEYMISLSDKERAELNNLRVIQQIEDSLKE